jgi:hypothetical protein
MLGADIIGFFQAIGPLGLVTAFAVISFLDGFAIPTLPEAWLILIALTDTTVPWGLLLVLVGTASAVGAQFLLYSIVRKTGMPSRIKKVMNKYTKILIVPSEKLAFVNWLAPVVPFTGAFIAVREDWKPKLAFSYSVLGGLVKMTILVAIAILFPRLVPPETVADASLVLILVVLAVSIAATLIRHRRIEKRVAESAGAEAKK